MSVLVQGVLAAAKEPLVLLSAFQNNCNYRVQICLTKNGNFDLPTTKDKIISGTFSQNTTNTSSTYYKKTKSILVILHLALICVFGPRIAFILGRREYIGS